MNATIPQDDHASREKNSKWKVSHGYQEVGSQPRPRRHH